MVFFCTFLRKRKSNAKSVTCSYWTRTEKSALLCRRKLSTVSVRIYLYQHIRSTAHYGNWELSDWWEKGNWIATDTIIIDGKQFIWWSIKYTGIKQIAIARRSGKPIPKLPGLGNGKKAGVEYAKVKMWKRKDYSDQWRWWILWCVYLQSELAEMVTGIKMQAKDISKMKEPS